MDLWCKILLKVYINGVKKKWVNFVCCFSLNFEFINVFNFDFIK